MNVPVQITGVGFFDFPHGQRGLAPNDFEIHPVLAIEFPGGTPEIAPTGGTAAATTATVIRSSNVRHSPSKKSKIRGHLDVDDVVTVLSPESQNGYLHVKTEEGVTGWVLAQNLRTGE